MAAYLPSSLWFIIGILAGLLLGRFPTFELDTKINPGQILNTVATLAVGLSINVIYAASQSKKKLVTDLLLEQFKATKSVLTLLSQQASTCGCNKLTIDDQDKLTRSERELSNSVHSLELALTNCGCMSDKLQFSNLKNARLELRKSLTGDRFPGPYDSMDIARINRAFKTVSDELLRINVVVIHQR